MTRKQAATVKNIQSEWKQDYKTWDTVSVEIVEPWRHGERASVFCTASLISNGRRVCERLQVVSVGMRGGIKVVR